MEGARLLHKGQQQSVNKNKSCIFSRVAAAPPWSVQAWRRKGLGARLISAVTSLRGSSL